MIVSHVIVIVVYHSDIGYNAVWGIDYVLALCCYSECVFAFSDGFMLVSSSIYVPRSYMLKDNIYVL